MNPLHLVGLSALMQRGQGRPEIRVALIDGPVALNHPDLAGATIRQLPAKLTSACSRADSAACSHGTFVAGILAARRGSAAPSICPGCTLLVRPIFAEGATDLRQGPSASPEELAQAIIDGVSAGAHVVNLSSAFLRPSPKGERLLEQALSYAAQQGSLIVAAAGNQGTVGSSAITRHPWVIPVTACDSEGRPLGASNLGHSIGRQGLRAPGENITSLGATGPQTFSGTSAAAPFVTGAIALLWSEFAEAGAAEVRLAIARGDGRSRHALVPPLLDAGAAFKGMMHSRAAGRAS